MVAPTSPSPTGYYVGLPLWDEVKRTLFGYWNDANNILYIIDKRRIELKTDDDKALGSEVEQFKAATLRLYRACRSKLNYHAGDQCVKDLKAEKIDDLKPRDLTLAKAETYFRLLTDFLEIDGVTRFEMKKFNPEHALVSELEAD